MYYQREQSDVGISVGVNTKEREREALENVSGDEFQDKDKAIKEDDNTEDEEALLHIITHEDDEESKDLPETVVLEKAKEANNGSGFETFTTTRARRVFRPSTNYGMAIMALTHAEMGYHANLCEIAMMEYAKDDFHLDFEVAGVGSGIRGGLLAPES
eukprot:10829125-Ditylum_brightwellii.AAC.1